MTKQLLALIVLFFSLTASAQYDPLYGSVNIQRLASLRGYEVGNNQVVSVYGTTTFLDGSPMLYYYSETSTLADNGTTVIKPDSKTNAQGGRWLFLYKLASPMGGLVQTYSGTTNASGVYTVTFPTAYSQVPNVQASINNQTSVNQFIRVSNVTTTGFTVNVYQRNSVNLSPVLNVDVLLSSTVNVSGAAVDVLVTPKN